MITRRTVLKGMGIAPFLPYVGMDSVAAAPLTKYAELFKACREHRMNIFFDDASNVVGHVNKMINALRTLDMSYTIFETNALDKSDFSLPTASGLIHSNIFDDVDVIVLEDFAKAMPVVQTLILKHIMVYRDPANKRPMFIITGQRSDKIYQRFHLYDPMFNFVAFKV